MEIASGVVGITAVTLHSARKLSDLISSIKNAPDNVRAISHDVGDLSKLLQTLNGFVKDASVDTSMAISLQDSLNNCNTATTRTQQEMEPFVKVSGHNGMAKWRRMAWTFNEVKVKEIRDHLQHAKANLNLWIYFVAASKVETTQIEIVQQIDVGTEAVWNGFTNLESQMRARENGKIELASVHARRGSPSGTTDFGLPLRKILEDLPPMDHQWAEMTEVADTPTVDGLISTISDDDDGTSLASLPKLSVVNPPYGFVHGPLHRAVCMGDNEPVLDLLDRGADVNGKGCKGCTALHLCADLSNDSMASVLLDHGASLQARDKLRRTPLHYAIISLSQTFAFLLVDRGVDVDLVLWEVCTTIFYSGTTRQNRLLRQILKYVALTAKEKGPKLGLLHRAVKDGDNDMVKLLLEQSFDVNEKDGEGFVPLHHAAKSSDLGVTEALLYAGADLEVRTSRDALKYPDAAGIGLTALGIAAAAGHKDMVRLLRGRGADVNARYCNGENALLPLGAHPPAILRVLLEAGADVNSADCEGLTLLFWATEYNNYPLVEFLLDHPTMRVDSATLDSWEVIHKAARWRNVHILRCLLKHGANINALSRRPRHNGARPPMNKATNFQPRRRKGLKADKMPYPRHGGVIPPSSRTFGSSGTALHPEWCRTVERYGQMNERTVDRIKCNAYNYTTERLNKK